MPLLKGMIGAVTTFFSFLNLFTHNKPWNIFLQEMNYTPTEWYCGHLPRPKFTKTKHVFPGMLGILELTSFIFLETCIELYALSHCGLCCSTRNSVALLQGYSLTCLKNFFVPLLCQRHSSNPIVTVSRCNIPHTVQNALHILKPCF